MTTRFPFLDVQAKADLPAPPPGFRYLDFLGGSRELRCFLVPREMRRTEFMRRFPEQLDATLRPIYEHRGVVVRQDCSYALPGFYIVSFEPAFDALDRVPLGRFAESAVVLHTVRAAMRAELGIEHIHLHYEEKAEPSCLVHFWLMPIRSRQGKPETLLTHLDLHDYLGQFRFTANRARILDWNARMRAALDHCDVADLQSAAAHGLQPPQERPDPSPSM